MMRIVAAVLAFLLASVPMVAAPQCKPQPKKHWVCKGSPSHATGYVVNTKFIKSCQLDAKKVVTLEKLHKISGDKSILLDKYEAQVKTLTVQRDGAMADVVALSESVSQANATIRDCNAKKKELAKVAHDLNDRVANADLLIKIALGAGAVAGLLLGYLAGNAGK